MTSIPASRPRRRRRIVNILVGSLVAITCQQLTLADFDLGDNTDLGELFQLEAPEDLTNRPVDADKIAVIWLSNLADWQAATTKTAGVTVVKLPGGRQGVRLAAAAALQATTTVPQTGKYRIWVSYQPKPGRPARFRLQLSGSTTYSNTFGAFGLDSMTPGRVLEKKHPVRFESKHSRMAPPAPGAMLWEYCDVQLATGDTTIVFSPDTKTPAPPIETIIITQSTQYIPSRSSVAEERTLGRLLLRIRIHGHQQPVTVGSGMSLTYMSRFTGPGTYNDLFTGKVITGNFADAADGKTLTPGNWSAWVDASFALTTGGRIAIGALGFQPATDAKLEMQLAWYPSSGAVAKTITTAIGSGKAYIVLPVTPRGFDPSGSGDSWTAAAMFNSKALAQYQAMEEIEAKMDNMCDQALAKLGGDTGPLQHLQFHANVQGPAPVIAAALPRLSRMGINRISPTFTQGDDADAARTFWLSYSGIGFTPDRQAAIATETAKWQQIRAAKGADAVPMVKLGDEIGVFAGPETINANPEALALFHAYLADELARLGKDASFLGVSDLSLLKCLGKSAPAPTTDAAAEDTLPPPDITETDELNIAAAQPLPDIFQDEVDSAPTDGNTRSPEQTRRLLVMSKRFIPWLTAWYYRAKTQAIQAVFPAAETFTNHATGFMWSGRFDPLWFTNCRYQGTSMACAEDWAWPSKGGTASCGTQTVSFYGAIMDCAAREHNRPKGFQTIATANFAARKIFSLVGEGVFFQDLYHYGPPYFRKGGTMDCWAQKSWVYHQVATALAALKPAEQRIVKGQPDRTRVAIIANLSDDLRQNSVPGFLDERLLVYLALRHAQLPVDLLLEQDLRGGSPVDISGYKAIYLPGFRLEREALATLQAWCAAGGTLLASGMAASQDEFGDPMPEADAFLGASRELAAVSPGRWHADNIPSLAALDTATFPATGSAPELAVPVVGIKTTLHPGTDSTVLSRFADGSAAACSRPTGNGGRVILYGFLPGMSYRVGTARDKGKIDGYSAAIRAVLSEPVAQAGAKPRIHCSEALVETTTFGDAAGLAVLLNDFTWAGDRDLQLTVTSSQPVHNVTATIGTIKAWRQTADQVYIDCTAPNPVDVLLLEYAAP